VGTIRTLARRWNSSRTPADRAIRDFTAGRHLEHLGGTVGGAVRGAVRGGGCHPTRVIAETEVFRQFADELVSGWAAEFPVL
jgi:hypothetical protein